MELTKLWGPFQFGLCRKKPTNVGNFGRSKWWTPWDIDDMRQIDPNRQFALTQRDNLHVCMVCFIVHYIEKLPLFSFLQHFVLIKYWLIYMYTVHMYMYIYIYIPLRRSFLVKGFHPLLFFGSPRIPIRAVRNISITGIDGDGSFPPTQFAKWKVSLFRSCWWRLLVGLGEGRPKV